MPKKLILYMNPLSQPSRSVLMVGAELGIEFDERIIDIHKSENMTPEYLQV